MLPVLQNKSASKMSLKEITDLIGVRHDKACLKVLSMAEEPEFGTVSIVDIVYNDKGQTIKTYMLDKRQSVAVASRLNTALLMRVIDRWQELESKTPVDPMAFLSDPAAMRSALLSYTEKVLELQPKADAFDAISNSEGELCLTDAAKYLNVPPRKFNQFLQAQGWIFKRNGSGSWTAYQRRIDQGFLTHKRVTYERNSGETEVVWQPLVTPEGIKFLSLYPAIQEIQSK